MNNSRFKELLEKADLQPFSYSGRGMYGNKCIAVRFGDVADLLGAVVDMTSWATNDEHNKLRALISEGNVDSLGRDQVMYWPELEWIY